VELTEGVESTEDAESAEGEEPTEGATVRNCDRSPRRRLDARPLGRIRPSKRVKWRFAVLVRSPLRASEPSSSAKCLGS